MLHVLPLTLCENVCLQSEAVQRLAFAPTAMTAGFGYLAAGGQNSSVSCLPLRHYSAMHIQSGNKSQPLDMTYCIMVEVKPTRISKAPKETRSCNWIRDG